MRLTTGEQLREVAAALKQDQRNYLHEVMQGQARIAELTAALEDILSGWKYIRSSYGDLYGVGWDRAQDKAEAALAKKELSE